MTCVMVGANCFEFVGVSHIPGWHGSVTSAKSAVDIANILVPFAMLPVYLDWQVAHLSAEPKCIASNLKAHQGQTSKNREQRVVSRKA